MKNVKLWPCWTQIPMWQQLSELSGIPSSPLMKNALYGPHHSTRFPCAAQPAGDLLAPESLRFKTNPSPERQKLFLIIKVRHLPLFSVLDCMAMFFCLCQALLVSHSNNCFKFLSSLSCLTHKYHPLKLLRDTPTEASSGLEAPKRCRIISGHPAESTKDLLHRLRKSSIPDLPLFDNKCSS